MVSFRYYLLEGDTAAPSWLLARLCHIFLVFLNVFIHKNYRTDRDTDRGYSSSSSSSSRGRHDGGGVDGVDVGC